MFFNQSIYEEIINKWENAAKFTNRPEMLKKKPLQEDLAKLVEIVFFCKFKDRRRKSN